MTSILSNREAVKDLPLTLQLDHINGIHNDNRLENLRLLCPNCHSQTETFAGRKPAKIKSTGKKGGAHLRGRRLPHRDKIQWPSFEELEEMVSETNYVQVAKKLGVSDKAVKKRLEKTRFLL